jgi:membrane protein YqaA with SNARE-associated domain
MDLSLLLQWADQVVGTFGYAGIFLVSAVGAASVIIPIISIDTIVFFSGSALNPLLVAVCAAFGATIGETVSYFIGRGGDKVLLKKHGGKIKELNAAFYKYRGGVVIFFISVLPLIPFDVVGLFCGVIKYDLKKFYIITAAGRLVRYSVLAFAGFYGASWVLQRFLV